jgi:hypothetical protein
MVVTTTATNTSIAFTANFIARSGTIAGAVDRTAPLSPPHFVGSSNVYTFVATHIALYWHCQASIAEQSKATAHGSTLD